MPDAPTPFQRFQDAVRRIVQTPKADVDRRMEDEKRKRAERRANRPSARP